MFGLSPKRLVEKNKNAARYIYLKNNISLNPENKYQINFDNNIQNLDHSIDENISFNSKQYVSKNELFDEVKYLFIKNSFVVNNNSLISNFVASSLHSFCVNIEEQLKKHFDSLNYAKQVEKSVVISEYEESKAKYDEAFDVLRVAFRIFDEHIDEADIEKSRAIVERRWADVGANEVLYRKLNTVKNQVFNFIKEKNKDD